MEFFHFATTPWHNFLGLRLTAGVCRAITAIAANREFSCSLLTAAQAVSLSWVSPLCLSIPKKIYSSGQIPIEPEDEPVGVINHRAAVLADSF